VLELEAVGGDDKEPLAPKFVLDKAKVGLEVSGGRSTLGKGKTTSRMIR